MDETEYQALLREIRKPMPAITIGFIHGTVKDHQHWSFEAQGNFIKLFEDCFDDLNFIQIQLNLTDHRRWKPHNGNQFLLWAEALKPLYRGFEDGLDGYYDEAYMVLRSVLDSILRMVFLSCYPDDFEAVELEKRAKGKRTFNLTNFYETDLKVDWRFLNNILCGIAHGKRIKFLLERIGRIKDPSPRLVAMSYEPNIQWLQGSMNISLFLLAFLFHVVLALYEKDFEIYPNLKQNIRRYQQVDLALYWSIKMNKQPKFSGLAEDIQKVGRIIREAENGGDWKKLS